MTVSTDKAKEVFTGDGSTTVFAVTFRIFKKDDVEVVVDGTTNTVDTDYEVNNIDNSSFDVDFGISSAPDSGAEIVVRRSLDIVQETDYTENDSFPSDSHEDALDLLTMINQQQKEELGRALKASLSESSIDNLPAPSERRNKLLKFTDDASANPTAVGVTELGSGNILDEDDFASDSADDAPSQQSVNAHLTSNYTKDTDTDVSGKSWVLDEDDFSSNSDTKVATQQSIEERINRSIQTLKAASDTGTDVYEVDLGMGLSSGDVFTADVDSANTTASPTLENTGGDPSGTQSIVTTEGAAFVDMLEARPHRFQWNGTNFVVLDPAGGVVDKGSGANGDYVLYGDGTLICRHKLTDTVDINNSGGGVNFSAAVTWTYPKAFTSAPDVSVQEYNSNAVWADLSDVPGNSSVDILFMRVSSTTSQSVAASLIAIGKG